MQYYINNLMQLIGNDIVMLDALYQWVSNPTSKTSILTTNCKANHAYIIDNLMKRYNYSLDKAKKIYLTLKNKIYKSKLNFDDAFVINDYLIQDLILNEVKTPLKSNTLKMLNKATQEEKNLVWLFFNYKDTLNYSNLNEQYTKIEIEEFKYLYQLIFNKSSEKIKDPIEILNKLGIINLLEWVHSKNCSKRDLKIIFPRYLESLFYEIDNYCDFSEPEKSYFFGQLENLYQDKSIKELMNLELILKNIRNGTGKYKSLIRVFDNRKKISLYSKIIDEINQVLQKFCEKNYPKYNLSKVSRILVSAPKIWKIDLLRKYSLESYHLIILTPWISRHDFWNLIEDESISCIVLIPYLMGIPQIYEYSKNDIEETLINLNKSLVIFDISRGKIHQDSINGIPEYYDELYKIIEKIIYKMDKQIIAKPIKKLQMKIPPEIKDIVKKMESHNLDFKQEFYSADKIGTLISAFANQEGGDIFFGIKDDKKIIGIDKAQEINNRISGILKNFGGEKPIINYEVFDLNERKKLVKVNIKKSKNLIAYKDKCYIRDINSSTTRLMTIDEIKNRMIHEYENIDKISIIVQKIYNSIKIDDFFNLLITLKNLPDQEQKKIFSILNLIPEANTSYDLELVGKYFRFYLKKVENQSYYKDMDLDQIYKLPDNKNNELKEKILNFIKERCKLSNIELS